MTHRAWYVRAGRPLAVGPGCSRTSDFLLLAQQLTVLLLPVLHVDQQRDETVLHLIFFPPQTELNVSFSNGTLFIHTLLLEESILSTVKNTLWLFSTEADYTVEMKLQALSDLCHRSTEHCSHNTKWLLKFVFLTFKIFFTSKHICRIIRPIAALGSCESY